MTKQEYITQLITNNKIDIDQLIDEVCMLAEHDAQNDDCEDMHTYLLAVYLKYCMTADIEEVVANTVFTVFEKKHGTHFDKAFHDKIVANGKSAYFKGLESKADDEERAKFIDGVVSYYSKETQFSKLERDFIMDFLTLCHAMGECNISRQGIVTYLLTDGFNDEKLEKFNAHCKNFIEAKNDQSHSSEL